MTLPNHLVLGQISAAGTEMSREEPLATSMVPCGPMCTCMRDSGLGGELLYYSTEPGSAQKPACISGTSSGRSACKLMGSICPAKHMEVPKQSVLLGSPCDMPGGVLAEAVLPERVWMDQRQPIPEERAKIAAAQTQDRSWHHSLEAQKGKSCQLTGLVLGHSERSDGYGVLAYAKVWVVTVGLHPTTQMNYPEEQGSQHCCLNVPGKV